MKKRSDGSYEAKITIDGKRKSFYGKTKAELNRKILEYQSFQKDSKEKFEMIAEQWKEEHEENSAHKTWECYSAPYKAILEHFSGKSITSLSPSEISVYIKSVANKGYSQRTVKAYKTILHLIFEYAILNGYTDNNPVIHVPIPKGLSKTQRELPIDSDIETIKQNSNVEPFGLFALFLIYTGCRRGEALAIQYEDIDFDKKLITINKSIYFDNNKPVVKSTKTEAGNRTVPLLDRLYDCLDPNGTGYLFCFDNGDPLTLSAFQKRWRRYCIITGIQATPHQLRHAYATILYEAGIDEKVAQELLGHASIITSRNIYTHIRKKRLSEAAEKLNQAI